METVTELDLALREFIARNRVLIALDFDGTLAPLVADPSQSRSTELAAASLKRLVQDERVILALISGRPGQTLAELAQPPIGTHLIGSHGAEIGVMEASGFVAEELTLSVQQQELLQQVRSELEEIAAQHENVWVEHKPASAALHTRPATPQVAQAANAQTLSGPAKLSGAVVLEGKSVIEIGVLTATKGEAITQLRTTVGNPPVLFMGDDVTDEHAFAVLNDGRDGRPAGGDIGVKVGAGQTRAGYRVADPDEVGAKLKYLAQLLESGR